MERIIEIPKAARRARFGSLDTLRSITASAQQFGGELHTYGGGLCKMIHDGMVMFSALDCGEAGEMRYRITLNAMYYPTA